MSEERFYVQNVERGYVGNSLQWWRFNDNGYTCDIRAAKKFTKQEAEELCVGRNKYAMWECGYIEKLVQHHIDMQDLRHDSLIPHTMIGVGHEE